eukprot:1157271-Pelagomonas_calceolata.AAC.9
MAALQPTSSRALFMPRFCSTRHVAMGAAGSRISLERDATEYGPWACMAMMMLSPVVARQGGEGTVCKIDRDFVQDRDATV